MSNSNVFTESFSLPAIESFDPSAFTANEEYSQDFCDLMLTLALFCNDLRDLILFHSLTCEAKPECQNNQICDINGQYHGLIHFIIRNYILKIKELSQVLGSNKSIISSREMDKVLAKLSKPMQKKWISIIDSLIGVNKSNEQFLKMLERIRHKISGHYEPGEIAKGYKAMFIENHESCEPYISRGKIVSKTRFYFADAASQGYYVKKMNDLECNNFENKLLDIIKEIADVLWYLVPRYINLRVTYRAPKYNIIQDMGKLKFE